MDWEPAGLPLVWAPPLQINYGSVWRRWQRHCSSAGSRAPSRGCYYRPVGRHRCSRQCGGCGGEGGCRAVAEAAVAAAAAAAAVLTRRLTWGRKLVRLRCFSRTRGRKALSQPNTRVTHARAQIRTGLPPACRALRCHTGLPYVLQVAALCHTDLYLCYNTYFRVEPSTSVTGSSAAAPEPAAAEGGGQGGGGAGEGGGGGEYSNYGYESYGYDGGGGGGYGYDELVAGEAGNVGGSTIGGPGEIGAMDMGQSAGEDLNPGAAVGAASGPAANGMAAEQQSAAATGGAGGDGFDQWLAAFEARVQDRYHQHYAPRAAAAFTQAEQQLAAALASWPDVRAGGWVGGWVHASLAQCLTVGVTNPTGGPSVQTLTITRALRHARIGGVGGTPAQRQQARQLRSFLNARLYAAAYRSAQLSYGSAYLDAVIGLALYGKIAVRVRHACGCGTAQPHCCCPCLVSFPTAPTQGPSQQLASVTPSHLISHFTLY